MSKDDLKEECLCGMHVHTATTVLMWLQIVIMILLGFAQVYHWLVTIICSLLCVMVLYGLEKKRPSFYEPYIVLTFIGSIIEVCILIYHAINDFPKIKSQDESVTLSSYLIVVGIIVISYYLGFIVPYRSYKLLDFEVREQRRQAVNNTQNEVPPPYQPYVINTPDVAPSSYVVNMPSAPPPDYVDKV